MGLPLSSLILGPQEALRIESTLSPAEAVASLGARVVPWGHGGLRGKVSEHAVLLYFVGSSFRRNSWRTVFQGRIEPTATGSALVGKLGLHPLMKFLAIVAVSFAFLAIGRDFLILARDNSADFSVLQALRWLWILPGLALFNFFGRLLGADEERNLRDLLQWILKNHVG